MHSRPLDKEKVNNQLRRLEDYHDRLVQIRDKGKGKFLSDDLIQGAAERNLQMAIETLLNLGNHIIAVKGLRLPEEYADIFRILGEAGIVDAALVSRYVEMARFRNKLVHLYWEIDKERVWGILENDLRDIVSFQQAILALMEKE